MTGIIYMTKDLTNVDIIDIAQPQDPVDPQEWADEDSALLANVAELLEGACSPVAPSPDNIDLFFHIRSLQFVDPCK